MHLVSALFSLVVVMAGLLVVPSGAYSGVARLPSDDYFRRPALVAAPPPPRPVYYRSQAVMFNPFFPQMRRMAFSNQL